MGGLQYYLDKAVGVLERFGILPSGTEQDSQLANLLQEVVTVDEPKVLAIAKTLKHMGSFNELVRDNIQEMNMADRYNDITERFDSIREDSKALLEQLEDGKIDWKESLKNRLLSMLNAHGGLLPVL